MAFGFGISKIAVRENLRQWSPLERVSMLTEARILLPKSAPLVFILEATPKVWMTCKYIPANLEGFV